MSTHRMFAVDLGASSGKCFVGTIENGALSLETTHRFGHEGVSFHIIDATRQLGERTHWDDTLLYQNIVVGLQSYRRDVSATLDSIGIDAWGADGAMITADGDMLGKSRIDERRVYEITGIHFQPYNVSNQLHWFVLNRRDLLKHVAKFLPTPTMFYYFLGGVEQVDSSWASVTQLMDAREKTWSGAMLRALEIPPRIMPEIVAPGVVMGALLEPLAASVGINRAKLIAVGAHDTASAFAAAPVADTREALIISSGTWSLVGKLIPKAITSEAAMAASISNEGGIGNVRFLKNCMGTWIVQELRRVWRKSDGNDISWEALNRLAAEAPRFAALMDPDDMGFYHPQDMERTITEYCEKTGQVPPRGRGGTVRAVYESLALKYRMLDEQLCDVCGDPTRVVHIVGGGSKNEILNQFTANALAVPVLAGPEEATAVGNLMVQAMGLGLLGSLEEAMPIIRRSFPIVRYEPRNTAEWDSAYERFRRILGQQR
jgi:rhamnulokinase